MQQGPIFQGADDRPALERRRACTAGLYQSYAPALFAYLRRHTLTLGDAEDILAEVFIGALRYDLSELSADEQRAWLWRVAHNKVSDAYRQVRRHQHTSLEALGDEAPSGETTPEQAALQQEQAASLREYLQRLPAAQQEVLQLRFIGGLRCTEIAALLNKREGAVRSMLSRALNGLRKYCEQ